MRTFYLVWLGQVISIIGSGLTDFALGVWIYQSNHSVTQLGIVFVCSLLPGLLISPLVGPYIDLWNRRMVMLVSDLASALTTIVVFLLLTANSLEVRHIYIITTVSSLLNAFQLLAYSTSISMLVPKFFLNRANGMIQVGEASTQLIAPTLSGFLLAQIQLEGVILIDLVTFFIAFVVLLAVKFPIQPNTSSSLVKKSFWQDLTFGWVYIFRRPGLFALLLFFCSTNFLVSIAEVLATPLVLSFQSVSTLGTVKSIAASGMLFGSIFISIWGGPQRRIRGVLGFEFLLGFFLLVMGIKASVMFIIVGGFGLFFSVPFFMTSSQTIWQIKVPSAIQGKVFSVRYAVAWASRPLGFLIAGPLVEKIFDPLMTQDKSQVTIFLYSLIGSGSGRGIGLLFIVLGVLTMLSTIVAYRYPPLRLIEDELPDFN